MNIFLHTKDNETATWENRGVELPQIPSIGDHIALTMTSDYYKVTLVVYLPFDDAQYDAEVYAIADGNQTQRVMQAGTF